MYVRTHLYMYIHNMYINTCSIREGHFTCDAVAVNSNQSSVLNDLNYTVVDVIYHSVYTLPSFNICILKHKQHTCIRASVDALSRDGTIMRGDAQNPKSFQAPRM